MPDPAIGVLAEPFQGLPGPSDRKDRQSLSNRLRYYADRIVMARGVASERLFGRRTNDADPIAVPIKAVAKIAIEGRELRPTVAAREPEQEAPRNWSTLVACLATTSGSRNGRTIPAVPIAIHRSAKENFLSKGVLFDDTAQINVGFRDERWDSLPSTQPSKNAAPEIGPLVRAKRALKEQQVWAIRFWLDEHRRVRVRGVVRFCHR